MEVTVKRIPIHFQLERQPRNYSNPEQIRRYCHDAFYQVILQNHGSLVETMFDTDSARIMRREKTALKYFETFRNDMEKFYPDINGLYYNAEEWTDLNVETPDAYDEMECRYGLT